MMRPLKAPFPYFGGKSAVAHEIWARFGNTPNYVEPFAGSLAVLLARPHAPGIETVNDLDGFISNFWRAVQHDPDAVARWADWPVNENDLHARHAWLVAQRDGMTARLEGNPDYSDPKVAGWWLWGICSWIGSGWCSGNGPWHVVDDELVLLDGQHAGINRQLVHLGNAGQGINRQRDGIGTCADWSEHLRVMMRRLSDRLRRVRVCSGDWARVVGPTPTVKNGLTAVLLDPPYSDEVRRGGLYRMDDGTVAADARGWAIEHGDDPRYRIALCGYDNEHGDAMPANWSVLRWKSRGGYGSQGDGLGRENSVRETIWFSPHSLNRTTQSVLPLEVAR